MELYILRHAIAADKKSANYQIDSKRPLTSEGKKKMKQVAKGIRKLALSPNLILSSPYARAKETAEIAAKILKIEDRLTFSDHLIPQSQPKNFIRELRTFFKKYDSIMLVGHEPFLGQLISFLICGSLDCALELKKASLVKLTVCEPVLGRSAILNWLLAPSHLISLADSETSV